MSEMVERVAKAIHYALCEHGVIRINSYPSPDPKEAKAIRAAARAAIDAALK